MVLFGKKKLTLDEILEGIKDLSEEDKAKALAAMQGEEKAAPTEMETQAESTEGEEVKEEKAEATAEPENVEEPAMESETEEVAEPMEAEAQPTEEVAEESADVVLPEGESATDEMAEDNRDQIIHQLSDKVNELSEQIQGLLELKTLMEEYTGKQAESFGYKGNVLGAKKDFKDMSTDELKAHAIKGI